MKTPPISAYQETFGFTYFARMLDKIRLNAAGNLREDFIDNLGKALDQRCVSFLEVEYAAVVAKTLEGASDEDVLEWCFENGRRLTPNDIWIWNEFLRKLGWNDPTTETLERRKVESGLGDRAEIVTMLEYFEYDEGRKA